MITWGQLAKSQTDPEKIEEAIKRLINEHNADPEAHLVEGGSLKSHKVMAYQKWLPIGYMFFFVCSTPANGI
jgi:hypothetical protein